MSIIQIVKIQRFIRRILFRLKIEKSKKLLYALYQGWKVRKLLQDNEILNALMGVQDINAYIEELEYGDEIEILESKKIERKKLITEFIDMLRDQLDTKEIMK
jgi:RNA binding exosome subunit